MEFWMEHVAAMKRDELTASEYARQHGLSVTALYCWCRKLRSITPAPTPASKFMTLNVARGVDVMRQIGCTLTLAGVRLDMPALPPPEWLVAVALMAHGGR
jgi:transposase-like protein